MRGQQGVGYWGQEEVRNGDDGVIEALAVGVGEEGVMTTEANLREVQKVPEEGEVGATGNPPRPQRDPYA